MSIRIDREVCVGCSRCTEACPGNLIQLDEWKKAYIRYPRDCWGCTSCLKECRVHAIQFYLGADMGGMGSTMTVSEHGDIYVWEITDTHGNIQTIEINKKDANKY